MSREAEGLGDDTATVQRVRAVSGACRIACFSQQSPAASGWLDVAFHLIAALPHFKGLLTQPMNLSPPVAPEQPKPLPQVVLAGVRVHAISETECVEYVQQSLEASRGGWIATANLDHLRRLQQPGEFRRVYESAMLVVADGMPLIWAARLQGTPLPGRVAGSDLINSLAAAAGKRGGSVFLLGGDPGTAEAAAERLVNNHPGLRIAGTCCPPHGFDKDPAQLAELRELVAQSQADIVFVALGSPKQELLIDQIHRVLPTAWWIGVGISFSFVSGDVRRAPVWIQRLGMEWMHRLLQEPRRLGARYLWHGPPFFVRLIAGALRGRVAQPATRS